MAMELAVNLACDAQGHSWTGGLSELAALTLTSASRLHELLVMLLLLALQHVSLLAGPLLAANVEEWVVPHLLQVSATTHHLSFLPTNPTPQIMQLRNTMPQIPRGRPYIPCSNSCSLPVALRACSLAP